MRAEPCYIPLTKNNQAVVSDFDIEILSKYKWYSVKCRSKTYAAAWINGRQIFMHRFLLGLIKGQIADHIDGDGLNNTRSNLRIADCFSNNWNRKKRPNSFSKFKGVFWYKDKQRWKPELYFRGKKIYLGSFTDELDAAKAYNKAAKKYFGNFATLNNV